MENLKLKTVIDWIITANCPLRCEHCIVGALVANAENERQKELDTAECKKLVDFLHQHGARALSITGGEALTRKDLFEIIDYARLKRLKVFLYTTGLSFINTSSGEMRSGFIRKVLSRIDFLGVSLDTYHDAAYRKIGPSSYCEKLVRGLIAFAHKEFPELGIQLFTVLGRRNGEASVEEVINDCCYVAGVINTVVAETGYPVRWRISPFRFSPGSMLSWQKKLLFSREETMFIEESLRQRFAGTTNFTMHMGVDYDSFFVYPDGKFRTVRLDKHGIDRFIELGTFRDLKIMRPEVWQELYDRDGQTAKLMERTDILELGGKRNDKK